MSISTNYDYKKVEEKWYQYWLDQKIFESKPDDRKAYTIAMPPPNVTGVLHMGHMLNNTLQDVLIRKARMQDYNACWVPGTDHASIATEAKVTAKLKEQGITKDELTRKEFLKYAWKWTGKHVAIILEQMKKLGVSCDWSREAFTLDKIRSKSIVKVFVDLYRKGRIYRGYRMVNWDPQAKTTISDEEVIYKKTSAKLYYIRYPLEDGHGHITVATIRPETILGDVAICVNPKDKRYHDLIGKKITVPIANRSIPVIADDYVDKEFGTGCLKITPAHDVNDKKIGDRYNLEVINVLNEDGTLNEHGLHYKSQDRFLVRRAIARELDEKGFLVKVEDYRTSLGTSERTGTVIEPRLSVQWFLKMKELAQPALKAVMENEVELIPKKFKNTYCHWMKNVHDWSISRQLWWGHQVPAWYYGKGDQHFVVAESEVEALRLARAKTGKPDLQLRDIKQDEDVLDTWFSSWLWPISVFDGIRNSENEEVNYYYPTQDLVTAPEILFFWVARMIMAGYEYRQQKPFSKVYLTGIVRDKLSRKMSKSLGNSPDPIKLIEKYSADGMRVGMLLTSTAGNDLLFDEQLCLQGRNFVNKTWNALRLIKSWKVSNEIADEVTRSAMQWFAEKKKKTIQSIEKSFAKYRISEALMNIYKLVWDDFCNWYLEAIKPQYGQPIDREVLKQTIHFFEEICVLIHPFMPFISEEVWHLLKERRKGETICIAPWPKVEDFDMSTIIGFEQAIAIINGLRNIRASKNIPKKDRLSLYTPSVEALPEQFRALVMKLGYISEILKQRDEQLGFSFLAGKYDFFVHASFIDLEKEKNKLRKDLNYQLGFLKSVEKKLNDKRFMQNAPEWVVNNEHKKKSDTETKIKTLEKSLQELGG